MLILHVGRILQYLASEGMVEEVGEDQFTATGISRTLSLPGFKAGLNHQLSVPFSCHSASTNLFRFSRVDTLLPCWQSLPRFLADAKYENPSDSGRCAFQLGHNIDVHAFMWALSQPTKAKNFQIWMNAVHQGKPSWLDVFPFEQLIHNLSPQAPLFVDVGGGMGSQCGAVRAKFPQAPGRVVLQELPPAIQQAIPMEGVEFMVHDFWTEQPIKGIEVKRSSR